MYMLFKANNEVICIHVYFRHAFHFRNKLKENTIKGLFKRGEVRVLDLENVCFTKYLYSKTLNDRALSLQYSFCRFI